MDTYKKLFDALRQNVDSKINPSLLEEMGMKKIIGMEDCWWSSEFASSYFNLCVTYNEAVLDIVEAIIALDIESLNDDIAEQTAGKDW